MEQVSKRELKNNWSRVWKLLKKEGAVIITNRGKAEAVLLDIEEDWTLFLTVIRKFEALKALREVQDFAEKKGLSELSMKEIEEEIIAARKEKESKGGS